jgi:ribonuclease T2
MKKRLLPILALLLLPIAACNSTQQPPVSVQPPTKPHIAATSEPTAPQNFDYYLLNISWSPEFCYSHRTAPECAQRYSFLLHGLWPQNTDGTYPQNCSNAPGPADPSQYSDIYPEPGLLEHEWKTHGTCSGLSPDTFFTTARTAFRSLVLPISLTALDHQISLPPAKIVDLFTTANPDIPASALAVSCGNNYLTAVQVCLDKELHATACGPIRSCRANTVRIPPP